MSYLKYSAVEYNIESRSQSAAFDDFPLCEVLLGIPAVQQSRKIQDRKFPPDSRRDCTFQHKLSQIHTHFICIYKLSYFNSIRLALFKYNYLHFILIIHELKFFAARLFY